jgi:hypothetical protein
MAEAAVAVIDAVLELVSEQGNMAKLCASPDVLRCDWSALYVVDGPCVELGGRSGGRFHGRTIADREHR